MLMSSLSTPTTAWCSSFIYCLLLMHTNRCVEKKEPFIAHCKWNIQKYKTYTLPVFNFMPVFSLKTMKCRNLLKIPISVFVWNEQQLSLIQFWCQATCSQTRYDTIAITSWCYENEAIITGCWPESLWAAGSTVFFHPTFLTICHTRFSVAFSACCRF